MSELHMCDLCDSVIKPNERSFLTITTEKSYKNIKNEEDYKNHYQKAVQETREICPTCNNLIENIFKLRYNSVNEIAKNLSEQFNRR